MNSTTQMEQLLGLAGALGGERTPELVLDAALPALLQITGARTVSVVSESPDGPRVIAGSGPGIDPADLPDLLAAAGTTSLGHVVSRRLTGHDGVLVLVWAEEPEDPAVVELALATLESSLARAQSEERLADLVSRVDNAQHLANMGDYDWHIPTDVNRWSDQLFRIYGHQPQSFNPTYETFVSLIHPADRERITALHQHAYATGEPYQMIERIVRPDGEVRYLSSNGEVIMDADSKPVRMRGTCIDITDRVLADLEREHIGDRFQGLVDAAPDAILVLGEDLHVLEANHRAHTLLGGDPQGRSIQQILPGWPETGIGVLGSGLEGDPLQLDVINVGVNPKDGAESDDEVLVALFLRDATPRIEGEALAARLVEAQLRRRQALEINDNVVQGLVAAVYALEQGAVESSMSFLDRTLTSARAMMDDLLDPLDGLGLQPGDLVRSSPAVIGPRDDSEPGSREQVMELRRSHSVLVVDDAEDLRMLLCARMETYRGLTVVGQAADGVAAVEMASELQPDLVLLDLAMPRMDGLEALPLIRAAVPGVRVIVLSGFNQNSLAKKAMEAGADHYVVKGGSLSSLFELADSLLEPAS